MTIHYKNPTPINPGENSSPFLGILEGKAKARKDAAAAAAAIAVEKAKQDTYLLQALGAAKGYDPVAAENQAAIDTENAKSKSDIWLYSILGVVVVVVMVGLYFLKKR